MKIKSYLVPMVWSNVYGVVLSNNKGISLIDERFVELVSKFNWQYKGGYAFTTIDKQTIRLHHLIVGFPLSGFEVDHINRDRLDNRLVNLRVVTVRQNRLNTSRIRRSMSRFHGVAWNTNAGKWTVGVTINHKRYRIGSFASEVEGAMAYDDYVSVLPDAQFYTLNFPDRIPQQPTQHTRQPKSKYVGVRWNSRCKHWYACVTIDGQNHYLGSYSTEDDAALVRDNFLKQLPTHKGHTLNFP